MRHGRLKCVLHNVICMSCVAVCIVGLSLWAYVVLFMVFML